MKLPVWVLIHEHVQVFLYLIWAHVASVERVALFKKVWPWCHQKGVPVLREVGIVLELAEALDYQGPSLGAPVVLKQRHRCEELKSMAADIITLQEAGPAIYIYILHAAHAVFDLNFSELSIQHHWNENKLVTILVNICCILSIVFTCPHPQNWWIGASQTGFTWIYCLVFSRKLFPSEHGSCRKRDLL